jgi:hypothetical protein
MSVNCLDGRIVVGFGEELINGVTVDGLRFTNPFDSNPQTNNYFFTHPEIPWNAYHGYRNEIAKHGDRIWIQMINYQNSSAWDKQIKEFQIVGPQQINYIRTFDLDPLMFHNTQGTGAHGTAMAMCATTQVSSGWQVLTMAGVRFNQSWIDQNPSTTSGGPFTASDYTMVKVGIPPVGSSSNITWSPIHKTGFRPGDVVYIPSNNTHVTIGESGNTGMGFGTGYASWDDVWLKQYDSYGNVIHQTQIPVNILYPPGQPTAQVRTQLFSYQDRVFFRGNDNGQLGGSSGYATPNPSPVYEWDIISGAYQIIQTGLDLQWSQDVGSDPNTWVSFVPPPSPSQPTSWDCVQIGDHPKFGHKCIEVPGGSGQFSTKQDCLRSGCEGINPDPGMPTTQNPSGGFNPVTGGTGGTGGATGSGYGGVSTSPPPKPPPVSEGERG